MERQGDLTVLQGLICDRIRRSPQQRITFAEFMELALYHPEYGYYSQSASQLGFKGDFITSVHISNDFGELLAEQLVEMWHQLGRPQPFQLVEMGPGQGVLADIVLTYLKTQYPDCLQAVHYTLVEQSIALRAEQQTRLQAWQMHGVPLRWCSLAEISPGSVTGCLFSNELVDAFPVHRVVVTEQGLQEQFVSIVGDTQSSFQMGLGPLSTEALVSYFEQYEMTLANPPYPIGYTTEVNLAALEWLKTVAQRLHRGYVMTIDYGYPANRYYSPARSQGTLQCYYKHAYHDDPLVNVGRQDITAHVDFTALEQHGQKNDLETLGCIPQELFLMALGLGDRLNELSQWQGTDSATLTKAIRRREAIHQLMSPMGLGKFTVLVQSKGLTEAAQKRLKGLTLPS